MWARHRLEWVTAVVAAVLGAAYLLLPAMGSDLSAQVARAGFFADHGWIPIDLRWYAGVNQLGYSLVSQPVMALLGVRGTGALCLLASSVLFAALLRRTRAPRPWFGAVLGAVCIAGNLVSGRVTYALGVAFALGALLLLTFPRLRRLAVVPALLASATSPVAGLFLGLCGAALLLSARPAGTTRVCFEREGAPRRGPAAAWSHAEITQVPPRYQGKSGAHPVDTWTTPRHGPPVATEPSPTSTIDPARTTRVGHGLLLAVPAAIPLALSALLFGDGGWMNISRTDTIRAVVASLLVAALVPRRPVRIAGLLSAAGVLAAALISTPVGLNATRLAVMFTLPVLAAYATVPHLLHRLRHRRTAERTLPHDRDPHARDPQSRHHRDPHTRDVSDRAPQDRSPDPLMPVGALITLLVAACWWQPPVVIGDLRDIGNPTADRAYFAPLLDRLRRERLTGRVAIPSTRDYWEAAYLEAVPLARGWLRQADIDRDPLFFASIPGASGTGVALTADSYRQWLSDRAVQFVAVPDAVLTWSGRGEAELVTAGLPYVSLVWSSEHWRLYAVADPQPIVTPPATLVAQDAARVTFDVPAAMDVLVRVHHYRWLTISGGARLSSRGEWTVVHVPAAGRYTLSSALG